MSSLAFRPRPRLLIIALLTAALALATVLAEGQGHHRWLVRASCPQGYVKAERELAERKFGERNAGRACMRASHPELPEDLAKFGEAVGLRFGGERPGQLRRALRQKAHISDSASIPGANGVWQPLGKGPLVANDPKYPSTYGDAYGLLAGRISDYAYDASTNRLWATVAQGGVWESTDRGKNWSVISDGPDGLPMQSSGGIGWTPAGGDGGTLIVLTGDHAFSNDYAGLGAYWTVDDGKTWKHARGIPDGALSFQIAVDPTNPNRVYAATGLGLFRSDNAGRSFENVKLPTGDCAGDSSKPDCFFANVVTGVQVQATDTLGHKGGAVAAAVGWRAGTYPNFNGKPQAPANGIYVSDTGATGSFSKVGDDNGITPTAEFGRAELAAALGPKQDSRYLYALVQNSKFFTDGNDLGDPDLPGCDPIAGLVCPASGSVVDGVYSSSDFGKTWSLMEGHDMLATDVTSGSSLTQLRPLGISAGYQVTYNEWIKVDPTQADASGVPTHLVFGMEELWQNRDTGAMDGPTLFETIGPYNQAGACLLVLLADQCSTTQTINPQGYTTHPDQHGGIVLPGEKGGVDLIAGNDGGNYVQHADSRFSRAWSEGEQNGFRTLLPYGVAMAKDRTVWAGLQDNGQMRIDPKTGVQNEVYGGDGLFTLTNPDNSDEAIEEYPGAVVNFTKDGGVTWSDMSPFVEDADFVTPLVQDPGNYKHIVTGGRQLVESTSWVDTTANCYREPDKSDETPDCLALEASTDWMPVYDLGTQQHPGSIDAQASDQDPGNHVVALRVRGDSVYAGFCGSCDPVKLHQKFHSGIATNVGGPKPAKTATPDGWHVASAKGLPQRIITGVEIDPSDAKTVYVTLGSSGTRPFAPLGSLGDDASAAAGGFVYVSHDAGETFADITGDLPKIQATWVRLKGDQLIVSNAIGVFISKTAAGKEWAALGDGFPTSPVYSFELEPADPDKIVVASFGRGVWEYDFTKRRAGTPGVLGEKASCRDRNGPASGFLRSLSKAARRSGAGLVLRGSSRFRKCKGGAEGKVKRVLVTLRKQEGKRCRWLTKRGTLGPETSCTLRPRYFKAKGTTRWSYRVRGPLPSGRYLAIVVAKDNLGNIERRSRHRNFRHFRLRGRAVIAGWHGRQRDAVG